MSPKSPLVRAVTVRPALRATDRAHVRALLLGLRSRYVVAALAIEEDQDGLVVRYDAPADVPTLASRLAAGPPLDLPETVRLVADVAWGLAAAAAAGLAHGRLDATQIVLGDGPARVVGVGLAGVDAAPAPGGDVVAPEVRAGGPPTEAADLWSLGVLLRDLTAGADVPLKLADLLARMLDEHPSRRPASARAVAARLVAQRIASPHVEPGPRRARPAAGPPAPTPAPIPAVPPAPPAVRPPTPPAAPTGRPSTAPAPLPRVSALRRPLRAGRVPRPAPAAAPPASPAPVAAPPPTRPLLVQPEPQPLPAAEIAGLAEGGRQARAAWRRRGAIPTVPPQARAGARPGAPPPPTVPAAVHPRGIGPAPPRGRGPLAIAVAIAVLIAAGVLVVLATGTPGTARGGTAAPTSRAGAAPASAPVATASASPRPRIPLPIVAATAPVDPTAVARLRALALQPTDVAAAATALPVPEQSNFDAVLRALYAECDYFSPVGQLPLAHRFTGFVDGDVEVFDDLTTYATGVPAQIVAGVATAITKCPTIAVPGGAASQAPASFAIARIDGPEGVPTDAVALSYERTDQPDDAVQAVFLTTGTTLRVVLALGPSLAQTAPDWDRAAARAWTLLAGAR